MTITADPLSLTQVQRLATGADTLLLRATRAADLETPIGRSAPRRRRAGLPARVGRGRRAARSLQLHGRRAAADARGPRRTGTDPVTTGRGRRVHPGLPVDVLEAPTRSPPCAASCRGAASSRARACRGSRAGSRRPGLRRRVGLRAVGPAPRARPGGRAHCGLHREPTSSSSSTTSPTRFRRSRRCTRTHRTWKRATGSRSVPCSRRWSGRRGPAPPSSGGRARRGATRSLRRSGRSTRASGGMSTSTRSRWPRTPSRRAKRSRSCWRVASRSLCRRRRMGVRSMASGLYRALRRVNPSPYLFFVRVPGFEVVGASPELSAPGRG